MMLLIKFIRILLGGFTGFMCLTGFILSFTERPIAPFIIITVIFGCLTYLLFKPKKRQQASSIPETIPLTKQNEPHIEYVETRNMIYRADDQSISDEEVPYLIQVGYEKALNKSKKLNDLSESEKLFFTELEKALSELNKSITMERLSNGVISVYLNTYYVGKIKLSGRKHWMQILRGETQIKTIDGELDDFIQHIPDWVRYIRLHCK